MKSIKTIFIVVVFSLLLENISTEAWQGYGNMSSSNLTEIWTFINSSISNTLTNSKYQEFCTNLSNHLNKTWDPAWNVYVIKSSTQIDTILYGYAFRDHWMWYNGYTLDSRIILGFIIWKDYNCQGWNDVASLGDGGFSEQEKNVIANIDFQINGNRADIWMAAKQFMTTLVKKPGFNSPDSAYSLVLSQASPSNQMFGRICLVENQQFTYVIYLTQVTQNCLNDVCTDVSYTDAAIFSIFRTR